MLNNKLPGLQEYYCLQPHNSFGFNVIARYWFKAKNTQEIRKALEFADHHKLPLMVIGEGTNLILTDDFPGLVLNICITGKQVIVENNTDVRILVGAGENWHSLVCWTLAQKYYGLENLSLIPGSVGAAPIQNIGAYGVELCQVVDKVKVIERSTGKEISLCVSECKFGYRDSVFKGLMKDEYIIIAVEFLLSLQPNINIQYSSLAAELAIESGTIISPQQVSTAVCNIRKLKLPDHNILGNAGSFFKNPWVSKIVFDNIRKIYPNIAILSRNETSIKVSAAWMIEQCGWKGFQLGGVGVHTQQALVLVNYGKGCGNELLDLAEQIKKSVRNKFMVELEVEPRIYP